MSLVNDYQIETTDTVRLLISVDIVDHRLICRERYSGVWIYLGRLVVQNGSSRIGKQLLENTCRLIDKRGPVSKKEGVLYPVVTLQHIDQRYSCTCLAGTGGHDKQTSPMTAVEPFAHTLDGPLLIIAVSNFLLY